MFEMQLSSLVGTQRGSEPSKEELKMIQNIVDTVCPRLCQAKAILQEIILALTPGRRYKKMTQALAERAVEVTSIISRLLGVAEETSPLLDDIFQLEQTLRDIYVFVQSETQRNPLLRILFAKELRARYFSLDKQLRRLLKQFEQIVKPLVLCATIQEDHPGIASHDDVEIVSPNNTSAIQSGSIFNNANSPVVHNGTFCAAKNLVVKQVHNCDRTPQGIVEGAEMFTAGDILLKKEIYKGRGYRVYSGTAKAKAVNIKLYEGSCAKDRCLATAVFSKSVMHPNVLHLIGVSSLTSKLPFLVYDESSEWAIESIIASALGKGLKQSLVLGLQTVAGLSSGLDYLRTVSFPFASVGLDDFVVTSNRHSNILISFDPEVLPDEAHEQNQRSGASNFGNELGVFHGLCQKTFDAACKAHYEFQKVQRNNIDELDADHDLDQDRFEEVEVDAETLHVDTEGPISEVLSSTPSAASSSSMSSESISPRKSSPSALRRELVWKSPKNETFSLEEIARQFESFLLQVTSSTELEFDRRRGRYTTKTAHRCPGYNRIEITLAPEIARSAIVTHLTPTPHEICPVCKEIVKDAEIFACICGRDDNESIPTIRCSTCSEWHHRPCVSIFENEDQIFVCRRCKVPNVTTANIVHPIYPALSDSVGDHQPISSYPLRFSNVIIHGGTFHKAPGDYPIFQSNNNDSGRHIRKHTGERPFSCHCSKQFSRLDNLRQHAQTVHSDKQELNDRMMCDLTSLHATMAAANKIGGGTRGGRRAPAPAIKQEDLGSLPRPGTSTGYEGYEQNHSFREPGQSFLGSDSFLSNHFIAVDIASKSSSRPSTSSGPTDSQHPRSLPPLSAVVSASLPSPLLQSKSSSSSSSSTTTTSAISPTPGTGTHLFPFPGSLALGRPTTATRPGTAPASASFFSSKPFTGVASSSSRPDFSALHSSFGQGRTSSSGYQSNLEPAGGDNPMSPQPHDSSPFYFHPPSDSNSSNSSVPYYQQHFSPPTSNSNPRKRAFASPDGPSDESSYSLRGGERPASSSGPYEYGSESRPQSRRFTVMELCNDDEQQQQQQRNEQQFRERKEWERERERCSSGSGAFLLSAAAAAAALSSPRSSTGGYSSRPSTSSGLVTSASALHIFDNSNSPPSSHSSPYSHPPISTSKSAGLFTKSRDSATSSTGNGVRGGDQCTGCTGNGLGDATPTDKYGHGHGYRYGPHGNEGGHGDASTRDGHGDGYGRDGETEGEDAVSATSFGMETAGGATTTGTFGTAAAFGADRVGGSASPSTAAATLSSNSSSSFSAAGTAISPANSPSSSTTPTLSSTTPAAPTTTTAASNRFSPRGADDDSDNDGRRKSSPTDGSPFSSDGSSRGGSTPTSRLSPYQPRQQPQQKQWSFQQYESTAVEQSQQSQFRSVQQPQQWASASAAAQRERQHKQQQHRQQRDDARTAANVRLSVSPHASAAFGMRV